MTTILQKQLYGIGIFENEIVLSDYTGEAERRFIVNFEQLANFFQSDITLRPFPGLIWMKKGVDRESYLIVYAAGPRTLLYRKGEELIDVRMTLPAMAVKASVRGSKINDLELWGFRGRDLLPETELYELPLPNLSRSSLCLGGNDKSFGDDVRAAAEKMIFDTPFNNHNHLVGKKRIPFLDYVAKHKGKTPFRTLPVIGKGRDILGGFR